MAAKVNPLDKLVAPKPAGWTDNFRIPDMPKLRDSMSGNKLLDGVAAHDIAMEKWRQAVQKVIEERVQSTAAAATATPAATAAATPQVTQTVVQSAGAVTSVNGKAGDVVLLTDDIIEGLVNKYLTDPAWANDFDRMGWGRNFIGASEIITVPSQRNGVWTRPVQIEGQLIINGHLKVLDDNLDIDEFYEYSYANLY